ncbi:DoxX family protein [Georgenia sp. EYE_87]|uniref:DoxX family protein n=1 Tax=Georgenia sp. EYE_87 TaxID=2853448 RepID=UPI0020050F0B|nr:DoxX family protein [Georgenia sp. EYE_87]MCK6211607.1 DoxX family protein [Georgenia sp. EYE_87]
MDVFLWIVAGLLAAVFLLGGGLKVVLPKERIRAAGRIRGRDLAAWTEDFGPGAIKAIGVLEVLAAIGLVVPPLVGVAPVLAPLAAVGLVLLMLGAAVVHLRRGELPNIAGNVVYLTLAAAVVWGRLVVEPFTA